MDTLNTLLIGWIIFTLFVIFLGTFFYDQVVKGPIFKNTVKQENEAKSVGDSGVSISDSGGNEGGDILLEKSPAAAVPTIVPQEVPEAIDTPVAAGADPDAVLWVNDVLRWLYNTEKPQGGKSIRDAWASGLNDYTVTSALDTGVLVEILEVLPQTPAPQLTNVVVDCPPGTDDMTITCDCMLVVYFRILSTRTAGPLTTESEYACAVERLAGRLHIDIYTTEQQAIIKFVGWPQVTLALEGIRNNSTGLDELTLQDVISELLTAALRNLVLTLHFPQIPNFPPFTRARQVPDRIVPIGYDSMVRDVQSHPPPQVPTPRTKKRLINGDAANAAALGFNNNLSDQAELTLSEEELIYNLRNGTVENDHFNVIGITENYDEGNVKSHVEMSFPAAPAPVKRESHPVYTEFGVNDILVPVPQLPAVKRDPQPVYTELGVMDMEPTMIPEISYEYEDEQGTFLEERENNLTVEILDNDVADVEIERDSIEKVNMRRDASPIRPILKVKEQQFEAKLEPKIELPPDIDEEEEEMPLQIKLRETGGMRETGFAVGRTDQYGGMRETSVAVGRTDQDAAAQQQSSAINGTPVGIPGLNGKRLLVKIVKAASVGCDQDVNEAYAVVEMDEPGQKFTTTVVRDTNSPFWDEQFLFDLSEGTLELLFELYDKSTNQFLGLAIVGIEELVATPSQRQIIPLQPRPYEDDQVSGTLTLEFLFLDRADIPELTLRSSESSQRMSPRGDLVTTTTTTYIKSPDTQEAPLADEEVFDVQAIVNNNNVVDDTLVIVEDELPPLPEDSIAHVEVDLAMHDGDVQAPVELDVAPLEVDMAPPVDEERQVELQPQDQAQHLLTDVMVNGCSDSLASSALRDIEERNIPVSNNANKSTMIIHASRKTEEEEDQQLAVDTDVNSWQDSQSPASKVTNETNIPTTDITSQALNDDAQPVEERGRSRGRSGKRDSFFGTLKKRFSRSRLRSKSMDPTAVTPASTDSSAPHTNGHQTPENVPRSISMERQTHRASGGDGGSTRSSLSDHSAISSSSTRTYVNENSTLIVEAVENGVTKHYLIPLSLQQRSKWRKKGTKLHVFNEHIFVAKHMSSSTPCQVCQKSLGRRLGKQGYECRDCGFKSHKPCHVKTDTVCPNSTVNSMDLEIVKDTREERRSWMNKNRNA